MLPLTINLIKRNIARVIARTTENAHSKPLNSEKNFHSTATVKILTVLKDLIAALQHVAIVKSEATKHAILYLAVMIPPVKLNTDMYATRLRIRALANVVMECKTKRRLVMMGTP